MTPTTSERDRFEAWAKDTMSLVKEPGGYKEATTHHAWRAWQAALTREQREGVCPKCNGAGGERWHEADGSENGQRCDVCDGFGTQPEAPGAGCVCGNPEAPYTVHRTDGPCYQQEAPGAVAWMTPESIVHLAKQNGVAKVDAWNTSDGNKRVPVFTTPPAPVDVRVDQRDRWHLASLNDGLFIINEKPSPSGTDIPPDWGTMHPSVVLNVTELPATKAQEIVEAHNALLDGQQAGVMVDDEAASA